MIQSIVITSINDIGIVCTYLNTILMWVPNKEMQPYCLGNFCVNFCIPVCTWPPAIWTVRYLILSAGHVAYTSIFSDINAPRRHTHEELMEPCHLSMIDSSNGGSKNVFVQIYTLKKSIWPRNVCPFQSSNYFLELCSTTTVYHYSSKLF